jgi:hypothetical protein
MLIYLIRYLILHVTAETYTRNANQLCFFRKPLKGLATYFRDGALEVYCFPASFIAP